MSIEISASIQAQSLNSTSGNAVESPVSSEIHQHPEVAASTDEFEIRKSPYPSGMFWKDSAQVSADGFALGEAIGIQLQDDSPANKLGARIGRAMAAIEEESPGLSQARWGFSVDEDGELMLTNAESLTTDQQQLILDKLNKFGAARAASIFADDMVAFLEADRGSDGYSNNIGQYDLTRSNFAEIIDLKEHYQYGFNETLGGFGMEGMEQIADQLSRKAESTYLFTYQF
ncbi:hypothetical protein [Gynuella sunshinyii]|uniref:Uncharacterized protein n=1 Tax=Gynuella sunshinyii YC6258 TaxID=1445510 RepID=A0A0C5VQV3_9GAMM|nr:hypothetical protein [Gynuella sunshinyii]AJQ95763.1 hypothetical Protein YC6258_03727 [Gynuella sunshinyii YC6258]